MSNIIATFIYLFSRIHLFNPKITLLQTEIKKIFVLQISDNLIYCIFVYIVPYLHKVFILELWAYDDDYNTHFFLNMHILMYGTGFKFSRIRRKLVNLL